MRIARIIERTMAEGPGCRFSIWVQGCPHHCEGCFATHLWDYDKGVEMEEEEILGKLERVQEEIEGVTFLGGEPMEQAAGLAVIADWAKEKGKNVITFTGYRYEELMASGDPGKVLLLQRTDVLIDGRFEKDLYDRSRPLVGSSNQRFFYLTGTLDKKRMMEYRDRFELRATEGRLQINGMGDVEKLRKMLKSGGYGDGQFSF